MTERVTDRWTTPGDLATQVRRRWRDGSLLRAYAAGEPFPAMSLKVRGPLVRDLGTRLADVQAWARRLADGSRAGRAYTLVTREVGGRDFGRNVLPDRAVLDSYEQAWRLLGVDGPAGEVATYDGVLAVTRTQAPELVAWVCAHPLEAIEAAPVWPRLLLAVDWLRRRGGLGLYLRQIEAPGVDTKFVAAHQRVLAALLDEVLPATAIQQRYSRGSDFAARYGFAEPPRLVRVRCADGFAGLPRGISEIGWRAEELAGLRVSVQTVVVVENLVTYLSWPVPAQGLVVWGSGYAARALMGVPFVRQAPRVLYSGDLDTHGFAILSLLRGAIPQVESVLMDRETLLAHRDRWGAEAAPTHARLEYLSTAEAALYRDLVEDVYAPALRLEQERLAWAWVKAAIDRLGI